MPVGHAGSLPALPHPFGLFLPKKVAQRLGPLLLISPYVDLLVKKAAGLGHRKGRKRKCRPRAGILVRLAWCCCQDSAPITASMRFFMVEASKGLMM